MGGRWRGHELSLSDNTIITLITGRPLGLHGVRAFVLSVYS